MAKDTPQSDRDISIGFPHDIEIGLKPSSFEKEMELRAVAFVKARQPPEKLVEVPWMTGLKRPESHPVEADDPLLAKWRKARERVNADFKDTASLKPKQLLDLVRKKLNLYKNYDKTFEIELALLVAMSGAQGAAWVKQLILSKFPQIPHDLSFDNLIAEMQAIKNMAQKLN